MSITYFTSTIKNHTMTTESYQGTFIPDEGQETELLNLHEEIQYQHIDGFGGALTDSAGTIYNRMNERQKKELLTSYFANQNMNYSMLRIPIDSCDFSVCHYEAVSDQTDRQMKSFQLKRPEETIFPMLDAIQKTYGKNIDIMLTPWSPPPFMKTNGERNHGGKLKEEYKQFWADYICHYIVEYRKRGYHVVRLSLQNEPKAVQSWDSCIYSAEDEKIFLSKYLWPALVQNHLTDVEIFIWDHNKERALERAAVTIDEETDKMISGIALHWYSGDHFEAVRMLHEKYPDKKLILSEACIEYCKYSGDDVLKNAQHYAHDMIGDFAAGLHAFYDWNLVLDEQGGPNHVGNYCDAPYLYHTDTEQLEKRCSATYLWHFSHFIHKNAVRIGSSCYTSGIETVAFKNEDGSIAVILLNRTGESIPVYLRRKEQCVKLDIPAESITTAIC